ncbi:MAG: hypothetical protein LC800_12215 [Acidobacteria bacterium]|nr:hypothetical protein [Acidobacteriota bacterium]
MKSAIARPLAVKMLSEMVMFVCEPVEVEERLMAVPLRLSDPVLPEKVLSSMRTLVSAPPALNSSL